MMIEKPSNVIGQNNLKFQISNFKFMLSDE